MIEGIEVIDHVWYQRVGIVLARNKETLIECAVIGTGQEIGLGSEGPGLDEDIKRIIRWGYRLDVVKAFAFFHNKLNCSKYANNIEQLWESKDD